MTLSHHATISSALAIVGLAIVLAGSVVTALAVIIKEDDAINTAGQIGAAPYGVVIPTREQFLQQPAVQNLIQQSKKAKCGLFLIAGGTFLQILGALAGLAY
jgi:hypothetical protein